MNTEKIGLTILLMLEIAFILALFSLGLYALMTGEGVDKWMSIFGFVFGLLMLSHLLTVAIPIYKD